MVSKYVLLKIGLMALLITNVDCKKKKKKKEDTKVSCLAPSIRSRSCSALLITCPRKKMLVSIDVTAGKTDGDCHDTDVQCFGRSPDLIVSTNECFWKGVCTIPFPNMKMITVPDFVTVHSESCFYQRPDFLKVAEARCTKKADITDICDRKKKKQKRRGVIRSHPDYPWDYDKTTFPENATEPCNWKYTLKPRKHLVVGLKSVYVCDTDNFSIRTKTVSMDNFTNNQLIKFDSNHEFVEFEFIGSLDTNGCEGFVICYTEERKKSLTKFKTAADVCNKVLKKATVTEIGPDTKGCIEKKQENADACCYTHDCDEHCSKLPQTKKKQNSKLTKK